jgi:CRP/FNR family cyclic AMP-dependent transcriptional regulator
MDTARSAPPSGTLLLSESVRALAARGVEKSYPKGTLLIHEGDVGEMLFIVLAGRVKAYSTEDGEREIVYGVYGPGDYLGEMSLDGGPRSASVRALAPTHCVTVTRQTLREHIVANPEFAFELLDRIIGRARAATKTARDIALLDVYGRVTQLLDGLAVDRSDGSRVIEGALTHRDIAARVGCSREMVSRLMKDLETGKFIAPGDGGTVLLRPFPSGW